MLVCGAPTVRRVRRQRLRETERARESEREKKLKCVHVLVSVCHYIPAYSLQDEA
jgi:hypothetical protein